MKLHFLFVLMFGCFASVFLGNCTKEKEDKNANDPNKPETNWTQLGSGFDNEIYDVVSDKKGHIYSSGGDIGNISIWNGAAWSRLGNVNTSPFTGGLYWPITADNNDNVYAVGFIKVPLANSEYHIAQYNSLSKEWINLTDSNKLFDNGIYSLATDNNGNLYVAGNVSNSQDHGYYIYKWNGSAWSRMGNKLPGGQNIHLHIDKQNNIYASFGVNGNFSAYVAKWNGSSWDELGGENSSNFGTGQIYCISSDSRGNIYAGGYFVNSKGAFNICKWTKTSNSWRTYNTHYNSFDIISIAMDEADTLYVGGRFVNTLNRQYVAKYHEDRDQWSDYGNLSANGNIKSICFDEKGVMYAGGSFTNSDNRYYVAKCNLK